MGEACTLARQAGTDIPARLGSDLSRNDRLKAVTAFRRALVPQSRPGRRPKDKITAAHRDWKDGLRGVPLYRKHIPGWERHSQWRRRAEEQRLMDSIRKRERRARERRARAANEVPCQTAAHTGSDP